MLFVQIEGMYRNVHAAIRENPDAEVKPEKPEGQIKKKRYVCSLVCIHYLRQVNEVNGGDNVFVRCVFVGLSVCVRSGRSWELNANSSKTVKATDIKFDRPVPRDSLDTTRKNFPERGRGQGHVTPKFLGVKC